MAAPATEAKKRAFADAVERDRRAFEMMVADKTLDFFTAMRRVLDEEYKRRCDEAYRAS